MGAKAQAEPSGRGRSGRRREILGIVLLAVGVFSALSLLSMHFGNPRMMGPGGAAAASGLYGLLGLASYLMVVGMLVAAWRAFRGQSLVEGFIEGLGALCLLASITVLLHLPFAGANHALRGPGGLMGQWLGEVTASFIGSVGAALAATALLFVTLLLVTDIELKELTVVVAWAAGRVRDAGWGILRATGRLVVAMFPEKDDSAADTEEDDNAEQVEGTSSKKKAQLGRSPQEMRLAIPAIADADASDAIRIGEARTAARARDNRRAAIAAIVAEVAAVEKRPATAVVESEDDDAGHSDVASVWEDSAAAARLEQPADHLVIAETAAEPAASADEAPAAGPIIVEPAWRTRLREREERAKADAESESAEAVQRPTFIKLKDGAYKLPGTDLLEYLPPQGNDTDKQGLYEMAERLEQAMSNYGVRGKVKEIHMGPVVTMFEFAPAPGTRTGKIANLEKDLAMALEAQAVRIVAPIPGKAVVGVEVPNKTREMVYLREILEDDCFTKSNSKLQVALGKDIKGAPVSVNLAKMPHLLVAGTTGSGKSVAVNGMIVSLLYNSTPEEVRFIMVDPKMLELSIYEGIPHLLLPVVTDPKKANLALRWAVDEMERRYEMLAKAGVRDIAGFNTKVENEQRGGKQAAADATAAADARKKRLKVVLEGADGVEREVEPSDAVDAAAGVDLSNGIRANADGVVEEEMDPEEVSGEAASAQFAQQTGKDTAQPLQKLPYIVIVIDEFADLMMVAPKDVETSVARIAQKARAAGLHLILATQRPSVDVITGLIKANFPSRIALQVASRIDSRTILDQPGADTLLGNGDMLFSDRGLKLRRVHGAFLGDEEVHRVVNHLKTQAKPVYDMDILKPREEDAEEGGGAADDFHDELYDQAVSIVCETRQASVSYIQRRLQIGYNRSARLVEQMEKDGIVGPANGAKAREVLAPAGEYLQHAG